MKKVLASILSLGLVFSLAACGNSASESAAKSEAPAPDAAATVASASVAAPAEATEAAKEETGAIAVTIPTAQSVFCNDFALGVKAIVLILGAFGIANMWEAVFADVGVSVIAILNSMRTLRIAKK